MKLFFNLLATISLMVGQFAAPINNASAPSLRKPPTATATVTATATATSTATSTATPTDTPTNPPTGTDIPVEDASPSPTATAGVSETPEMSSETPTPPAPTSTATQTPLATIEATASPMPGNGESEAVLTLTATPDFVPSSGKVMLHWEIAGVAELPTSKKDAAIYSIQFFLPQGVVPEVEKGTEYNETQNILTVPIEKSHGGQFQIDTTEHITGPIGIKATLFMKEDTLANASLFLASMGEFTVSASGDEISTEDGKIQVTFPEGALTGDTIVQLGSPSGDALPEYSLSGMPFEISAWDKTTGDELHQFDEEIAIEVNLEDYVIPEGAESDVHLYWYNPELKAWEAMGSWLDVNTNTLRALTDHFSAFDVSINNWQASRLPTTDSFQVSNFTGAGTFSLPIEVPAGPGGLQPSLSLSYNSQVVDSATSKTQASWVGMGWSFDTGSIERNVNGTTSYLGDDTYSLNVNGVSSGIVVDSSNKYHTSDENFWRIEFNPAPDNTWTVWDKQGNIYYFKQRSYMTYAAPEDVPGSNQNCQIAASLTYRWALTRVRNIHGQELAYTYKDETKPISFTQWDSTRNKCRGTGSALTETALYPETITYPNSRYRVRFVLEEGRTDYPSEWETDAIHHNYEKSRLKAIVVEQNADGIGAGASEFETVIRSYILNYTDPGNTANLIFPGVTYTAGGKVNTLSSIQQFGVGGVASLPAQTFTYGDNMHLKRAENGYGGAVEFAYEPWYYETDARASYKATYTYSEGMYIKILEKETLMPYNEDSQPIKPGGAYLLSATSPAAPAASFRLRLFDGAKYKDTEYSTNLSVIFILPADASKAQAYMQTAPGSGTVLLSSNYSALTTIYRVTTKKVFSAPGAEPYEFSYSYDGAAVNDAAHSVIAGDNDCSYEKKICRDLVEDFSEFRGHAKVTETGPDMLKTVYTFWQDDVLKGRLISVNTFDALGRQMASTNNTYKYITLSAVAPKTNDKTPIPYVGVARYFTYTSRVDQSVFNTSGVSTTTSTEYTYDDTYSNYVGTYGNLTHKSESANGSLYRTTTYDYFPYTTDTINLTGLVARQQVLDAGGTPLAETINLYDDHPTYDFAPTYGRLTGTRTLANLDLGQYAQVSYKYDAYGNQIEVIAYKEYGNASSVPSAVDAQYTLTCFGGGGAVEGEACSDDGYHTYPLWIKNSGGHKTSLTYDYTKGMPRTETDPNGAKTSAEYDAFGRMISLDRPDPDDRYTTLPSLTMKYEVHTSYPFLTTTITQKIDDRYITLIREYDGMGRVTRTNTGGVITDTIYDSANVTWQSVPYEGESPKLFTVTTYDPYARTTKVTAPDGTYTITLTDGLITTVTEPDSNNRTHTTKTTMDVWGRTQSVEPPTGTGPSVSYTYDEFNRLKTATRADLITTLDYNEAGQKTSMSDPDMGDWKYEYDALGNLMTQTDARECVLSMEYDSLNRLTHKDSSGLSCGTQVHTTYVYDDASVNVNGIGRRTSMEDASGSTSWAYDLRGRLSAETKIISGVSFTTSWTYNNADLPVTTTYPGDDKEVVTTEYNDRMLVDTVKGLSDYVTDSQYDSAGRMIQRDYNNGTQSKYEYYPWDDQGGRLESIVSKWGGTTFQKLNYGYDDAGNVTQIKNNNSSLEEIQSYGYDSLNRLTSWTLDSAPAETYEYDPTTGNLHKKAGEEYAYEADYPHAVDTYNNNSYDYDANGNMTRRTVDGNTSELDYDAEGRLVSVSGDVPASTSTPQPSPTPVDYTDPDPTATVTPSRTPTPTKTSTPTRTPSNTPTPTVAPAIQWTFDTTTQGWTSANNIVYFGWYTGGNMGGAFFHDEDPGAANQPQLYSPGNLGIGITNVNYIKIRLRNSSSAIYAKFQFVTNADGYYGNGKEVRFDIDPDSDFTEYTIDMTNVPGWTGVLSQLRLLPALSAISGSFMVDYISITSNPSASAEGSSIAAVSVPVAPRSAQEILTSILALPPLPVHLSLKVMAIPALDSVVAAPALNSIAATFVYDGDGKRVKSVINGVTTYFIGNHYEVTDTGVVTKYYYAGSQRIAMRKNGILSYLLTDHLGSTSLTTSDTGAVTSELRYSPWGEVRYQAGTTSTGYQYTGQYSYAESFGLMYYGARWYDSSLGRFAQADTIVPTGVQGYDRYAYVNNSPVRYTDPSGHSVDCGMGDAYCKTGKYTPGGIISLYRHYFGRDAIKGDSKLGKRLSNEVEGYMKSNSEYRPQNDPYLNRDWKNNQIFKEVRKDYWEERIRNHPGTSDTVWMLYQYYDWGSRATVIDSSYWDWNEVDWTAVKLDMASTFGSLVGLNAIIGGNRLYRVGYGVTEGASVGYALVKGVPSGDVDSVVLSVGSLALGPAGTIFSASSVVNDLLGAYQQNYTPYVPLIPRTP